MSCLCFFNFSRMLSLAFDSDTSKYIATEFINIMSCTYKLSLLSCLCFYYLYANRKYYSCASCLHMLAHGFRVETASGIIFSSWFASGKLTNPLQLHMNLQIPGGLDASFKIITLPVPCQNYCKRLFQKKGLGFFSTFYEDHQTDRPTDEHGGSMKLQLEPKNTTDFGSLNGLDKFWWFLVNF